MVRLLGTSLGVAVLAAVVAVAAPATAAPKVDHYYSKTYNDCMDVAGGSTMPMKDCIGAEHDAWDKQLNQTYQALMARRTAPEKLKLRSEERTWLTRTQFKCAHAGDDDEGGSLQTVDIDQCNLDETILRTVYLRGLS
jgi:uncharacterized protein YecT (DUF1311 family)